VFRRGKLIITFHRAGGRRGGGALELECESSQFERLATRGVSPHALLKCGVGVADGAHPFLARLGQDVARVPGKEMRGGIYVCIYI